ncbi:N-acetyltransferase [Longimycelium tulufanense]|uniref:N-acetyltransferase n=1 Tax=Longimycelium tulufanense TaxID=907463 RepID=A0A8J3FV06_9PSEU|nr:GNAT family N-acetyltransferase [Longimycelium tulufanense]GGM40015.1 N-acetyltransferase [Longimycelium tulufanense]
MDVIVTDAPERSRFEAHVDGRLAGYVQYVRLGKKLLMTHTEVDDAYEGSGVGSALARQALDIARRNDRVVRPLCPFIAGWIRRHPEYLELVDPVDVERVTAEAKS